MNEPPEFADRKKTGYAGSVIAIFSPDFTDEGGITEHAKKVSWPELAAIVFMLGYSQLNVKNNKLVDVIPILRLLIEQRLGSEPISAMAYRGQLPVASNASC